MEYLYRRSHSAAVWKWMRHKAIASPVNSVCGTLPMLRAAMWSDRGHVRAENQDTCAAAPEFGVFVVCDGMGGAAAGKIASQLAAEAFLNALGGSVTSPPVPEAFDPVVSAGRCPGERLAQAVAAANSAVYERAQKYRVLQGMGTTLVGVLVQETEPGRTAWIANVGDSRCYLLRNSSLLQLTTDHSVVEEQIQAGLLSREQAEFSPVRNIITRAIGTQPQVSADIVEQPLAPGDTLLLASDGLMRELADREISSALLSSAELEDACTALIQRALAKGGRDNITVLLISAD
jgi:PPM family protein phosphatase